MHRDQILDLLPVGIVVLDPKAKIRQTNRCASDLLRNCKEVAINHGTLVIRSAAHHRVFTDALAELAIDPAAGPIGLTIARSQLHPVSVVLTCLSAKRTSASQGCASRIVAVICDPDLRLHPPVRLLKQLFDFTPMEAEVAKLMLQYADTAAISKQLKVSHDTVRKHLQSMFAKTNCGHQAELLHVLLFNPAILLFSNGSSEIQSQG